MILKTVCRILLGKQYLKKLWTLTNATKEAWIIYLNSNHCQTFNKCYNTTTDLQANDHNHYYNFDISTTA